LTIEDNDVFNQRFILLLQYAMKVWNASHYGTWHLYVHTNGELPDHETSLSFDVGVDCHNFYPISYDEVKEIMSTKKWTQPFEPKNK
jgi:calcineurin-like phosphoesterase family protein